ncbi:MAG: FeoA family protein [Thermoleophilia bacterium]
MVPIGLLSVGEKGEVCQPGQTQADSGCGCIPQGAHARLEDLGLRHGQAVEMLNNDGRGPILVRVDNSRIAMDRGIAMKILVSTGREER